MKRRIFSMCLAAVILIGCTALPRLGTEVYAGEIRGGFTLTPENQDSTGVRIDSAFLLSTQERELTEGEVREKLQITPAVEFDVKKTEKGIRIIPQEKLKENSIYAFAFAEATWLFQTENEFYLQGVMPAHEAVEVPLDSGIEFLFSVAGAAKLEQYIEISPETKGSFEQRGNLAVFVPKERWKPKTIYTVLVKAGLPLGDSGKVLKEERAFQFETADKTSIFGTWGKYEYLDFMTWQNEIAVKDKPKLELNYYSSEESKDKITVGLELYHFDKAEDYIRALSEKANTPVWSNYADGMVNKDKLRKAATLEQTIARDEESWSYPLELPITLPAGYYLLEAKCGKAAAQTFLQVTDISSYFRKTDTQDVLWLHQVKSGNLLADAEVISFETADKDGKAIVPKEIERTKTNKEGIALLSKKAIGPTALILRSGEAEAVMYYRSWDYMPYYWKSFYYDRGKMSNYWNVLQLDRNLYQPTDKVGVFGFIMPRYEENGNVLLSKEDRIAKTQQITKVTAEITQDYWYFYRNSDRSLAHVVKELEVTDGFYSDELELPNLAEGSYQLRIRLGDQMIQTRYFRVEEYVKPAYKITITREKPAVFWHEPMNFTVNTQFFEGTPVSRLDFHYAFYGQDGEDGNGQTDVEGKAQISYQPIKKNTEETIAYCEASVSATLPESGEITGMESFRVFLKDAELKANAELKSGEGILSGQLHGITLERLNNGTAKDSEDYLDKPLAEHELTAELYRNKWVRTESGQHYDYINKIVVKEYEWHLEKNLLERKHLTTDVDGKFEYRREMKKEEDVYYTAILKTLDRSGNSIKQELYFWSKGDWYGNWYERNEGFSLTADKMSYQIGDTAELKLMEAGKEVSGKKVLYITAQSGLRQAFTSGSKIRLPYTEQEVPKLTVSAVVFGGYAAQEVARESIYYDTEQAKLEIKAVTEKESYRPGEEVKLLLEVKDLAGKPAANGKVHVKAIDEALLALSGKQEYILQELYQIISDGLGEEYFSHGVQQNFLERGKEAMGTLNMKTEESAVMAEAASDKAKDSGSNKESVRVREKFLDTAVFRLVELDENGKAVMSFQLPDNITSWRFLLSAVTSDLKAGSGTQNLKVSLPFFINASLNTEYLQGDQMVLGVTGYGSELKSDTKIEYQAFLDDKLIAKVSGKAFERVGLELPAFQQEGELALKVQARADNGLADALGYKLKVLSTHHEKVVSQVLAAEQGMKLQSNDQGMTLVCFIDREKSKYLPELYDMNYYYGERIDQRFVAKLAGELLKEIQGEQGYVQELEEIKISEYQKENGGIAVLPYAEDDVEITVQMLPLLIDLSDSSKDKINRQLIQAYLTGKLQEQGSREIAKLLYGLALLRQPILDKLAEYDRIENLSLEERLYIALAYAELGDGYRAGQIYEKSVVPLLEKYDTVVSLRQGDKAESYRLTGIAMLLAQKLGKEEALKMFRFQTDNSSEYHFSGAHKLNFIKKALKQTQLVDSQISYTYLGQEKKEKLEEYPISVKLPSLKLKDLHITEVVGNVDIVLTYPKTERLSSSSDKYLKVERKYFVNGVETKEFKEGDIIEVCLTWDISPEAPEGSYRITDYLPAGLKPIQKNFSFLRSNYYYDWYWQDVEGQKVSIYARYWKEMNEEDRTHVYYARVVSPGEFKAEAVVMQGMQLRDHIFVGEPEKIKISK